ncbi:MAG: DPP IV N-terminal domain-containing protein, partial [Thermomicrobiales bacterium]|nr:DPP IV N-terminal domain-containing protein [Thermomicrobiales bacterium]
MGDQLKSDGVSWGDYVRAERFLPWNAARLAFELDVEPHWIGGGDRFWYRAERIDGVWFFVVDTASGHTEPAFDHVRLAAILSRTTGTPFDAAKLPLEAIEIGDDGSLTFEIEGASWRYDPASDALTSNTADEAAPNDVVRSPDGAWDAFVRGHDLWIRKVESGEERQLTNDGEEHYAYGAGLVSPLTTAGIAEADLPSVVWSPDSSRLLTVRIDARNALYLHLVQSVPKDGSIRPRLHSYAYPLPGDETTPLAELWAFDAAAGGGVKVDREPIQLLYYGSPLHKDHVWWSADGRRFHHLTRDRGYL